MPINKLIIMTVILCVLFSVLSSGLLSATLDLFAFALLIFYLLKQKAIKKKLGSHHKENIKQ